MRWGDGMKDFLSNKWPEILILIVLVAIFGTGWTMRGDLSEQNAKIDGVTRRVDNIAKVLPDISVRVAYEALNNKYPTYVLTSTPYKIHNEWQATVSVVDIFSKKISRFTTSVEGPLDKKASWLLAGRLDALNGNEISFKSMERLSMEIREPQFTPNVLDKASSFALQLGAPEVSAAVGEIFLTNDKLDIKNYNSWSELLKAVEGGEVNLGLPTDSN